MNSSSASASGISVAYMGVHQAYQLALAAAEFNRLQAFYCSVYSEGPRWGKLLKKVLRSDLLNRRVDGLSGANIIEYPWPLVGKFIRDKFLPHRRDDWLAASDQFDKWSASQMERNPSRIFVGTETCDLYGLRVARQHGAVTVHDCPQVHPTLLTQLMAQASDAAGLPQPLPIDTPGMAARKLEEYALADWLLVYSDLHKLSFTNAGFSPERLFQCPLWVDTEFWSGGDPSAADAKSPLKALFVGTLNLRKGLPFLLQAYDLCHKKISLTLVGSLDPAMRPLLSRYQDRITWIPPVDKVQLREIYRQHDVFILPSVVDSFGFVALEAMACGLPVVTTANCGAPVPDKSWQVSAMDGNLLAERILAMADDRDRTAQLGMVARRHACQYTAAKYRKNINDLYLKLLGI
ncbi:glycosyltransferase family 4 protein [Verrucomicrobium spinosum]|uniref:glycosyltransferase family 4 protein n=1 Tax=Verrucomicrobium spinosum TaxID=2736 RepID=UPI00017462EC|nr:glycosyltransferase family 4 protein [Verrucomicrobium spinosum]